jgi:alkylated DNA repair protein (DNA oxidative demethylase)
MGGFGLSDADALLAALPEILAVAPFRHMLTPGGRRMAVAMTNCGSLGWVSDRAGYRYEATDPMTGRPWPTMPGVLAGFAARAARAAGFPDFTPDVCLINRYEPGNRLSLHQDRDERDFAHPIVSLSLGASAVFLFGGPARNDRTERLPLHHGDVVVWGGAARRHFHGVAALKPGQESVLGPVRINLTFRHAG